jgi:hypothetical protein
MWNSCTFTQRSWKPNAPIRTWIMDSHSVAARTTKKVITIFKHWLRWHNALEIHLLHNSLLQILVLNTLCKEPLSLICISLTKSSRWLHITDISICNAATRTTNNTLEFHGKQELDDASNITFTWTIHRYNDRETQIVWKSYNLVKYISKWIILNYSYNR